MVSQKILGEVFFFHFLFFFMELLLRILVHNAFNVLIEQKLGSLLMQFEIVVGIPKMIPLVFALDSAVISTTRSINNISVLAPVFPQSALDDIEAQVFKLEEKNINGDVGP